MSQLLDILLTISGIRLVFEGAAAVALMLAVLGLASLAVGVWPRREHKK